MSPRIGWCLKNIKVRWTDVEINVVFCIGHQSAHGKAGMRTNSFQSYAALSADLRHRSCARAIFGVGLGNRSVGWDTTV